MDVSVYLLVIGNFGNKLVVKIPRVTGNKADFLVKERVLLEFKAKRFLQEADFRQMQRYLQATGIKLGILVNFGGMRVQAERVVLIDKSKAQIVQLAMELGAPIDLTWSCYGPGPMPCGSCDSCALRAAGFREAGYADAALARGYGAQAQ